MTKTPCTVEDEVLRWNCPRCGSERIERLAWVRPNGETVVNHDENQEIWCPRCQLHYDTACQVNRHGYCLLHDRPRAACRSEIGARSHDLVARRIEELRPVACDR